ncbi:MAG: cupin [Gammaproteobacteria bacterium]|nr:cupin [Gammaproteobacteria bacterium]
MHERSAAGGSHGDTMQAEVRLPSRDLHADLSFYGERLGFRLESIFPADNPAVAVMTGHGLRIRLDRGADDAPGTLLLLCDRPEAFAAGKSELEAPGGTRIEIRSREPEFAHPPTRHALVVQRMEEGESWIVGRAGMQYRDLIPGRLGGAVIASHIRIPQGGPVPDMVHFHTIAFQLIYCCRGWFNVVYEDQGPPFRLEAGDCVIQPPEIRHRVLESSDNAEVIELGVPAEHPTTIDHELTLPTGTLNPRRVFGGQRFCRHRRRDAAWEAWRLPGFEARRTGIADATGGVANVEVARAANEAAHVVTSHDADILFTFVLEGAMRLRASGREVHDLRAGDAFVIPPRTRSAYEKRTPDLELLEVSLPGTFETTAHDGL